LSPSAITLTAKDLTDTPHRVGVFEKTCGCCLFDKIWKWKDDSKAPIAGLVHFFYQFAREIDTGVVTRVSFEGGADFSAGQSIGGALITNALAQPSGRRAYAHAHRSKKSNPSRDRQRRMQPEERVVLDMYCATNDVIVVAIFVSNTYVRNAEELVTLLLQRFTTQFRTQIESHRTRYQEMAKKSEEAFLDTSFMTRFSSFEDVLLKVLDVH